MVLVLTEFAGPNSGEAGADFALWNICSLSSDEALFGRGLYGTSSLDLVID